ncbi:MAG: PIN domain-containing protein [Gemmatimonadota bacterium]|nr:PIN domain-containing protein [Gemmatimonadota bacterium]MDE2871447.1 PIN domain-containing protein [Gemmatimonadota bacterium]
MIVDTSAWVEYLRATGSPTHLALRAGVQDGKPIATPALVVTELLSGSRSEIEAAGLLQLLSRFEILIPDSLRDHQGAARIQRICRRAGFTIRSTVACMVAATALEDRRPLLARNRDFAVIARHTELELVIPPDAGAPSKPLRGWSGE